MVLLKLFKSALFISFVCLVITGCTYEDASNGAIKSGVYKGIFIRTSEFGRYVSSSVTITITGNRFSGSSSMVKYPAICKGTYAVAGSSITFADECFWTAEFDWSLILNGTYELTVNGKDLEMKRTSGGIIDVYTLTLQ